MGCFSGLLVSAASDQKLFCELCSLFCCSFNEFVEEKVITPSYSSAILTPPRPVLLLFSSSVMSDSLRPCGLQHARLPCPPPTPGVYSNSCSLNRWCHPTISSSVVPFSSCLQSFPTSGYLQMNQLFASVGQSIGVSDSASVLQMNSQDWFPLEWAGWISLQFKGLSRVFSNTTVQKHQFLLVYTKLIILYFHLPFIAK